MHLFTCERWSGEMTDCDEGELVWLPKTEMNSLPMWEGDRIFHRLLDEGVPFFELELVYSGEKLLSASLDGRKLAI
jgi:8-oxo-dGTP diphosphatase